MRQVSKLWARLLVPSLAGRETNPHRAKRRARRLKRRDSEVSFAISLPDQKQAQGGNIGDYKEGHHVLNPDCGFAPGSAAKVDLDEVYEKLRNQVEAAKQLREIYS